MKPFGIRYQPALLAALALLCLRSTPGECGDAKIVTGRIAQDSTWSGEVLVVGKVFVAPGATLTIAPGTDVSFRNQGARPGEARIYVQRGGRLLAVGEKSRPIRFRPQQEGQRWFGIELHSAHDRDRLLHCRVEGSEGGIVSISTSPLVEGCSIAGNDCGASAWRNGAPQLRACEFQQNGIGVRVTMQSSATIADCTIEKSERGVSVEVLSGALITGGRLSGNAIGIYKGGPGELTVTETRFASNETGVRAEEEGADPQLRGNTFVSNRCGVSVGLRGSATISQGAFSENEVSVAVDGRAVASIHNNDFEKNRTALKLTRTAAPWVARNRFVENGTAVLCERSSYPTIVENDFLGNGKDVVLGENQSYAWTKTIWPAEEWETWGKSYGEGRVLAQSNYWGPQTTRRMEQGEAALPTFTDGRNTPPFVVDGKNYALDRVDFTPFSPKPVPGAGKGGLPPALPEKVRGPSLSGAPPGRTGSKRPADAGTPSRPAGTPKDPPGTGPQGKTP